MHFILLLLCILLNQIRPLVFVSSGEALPSNVSTRDFQVHSNVIKCMYFCLIMSYILFLCYLCQLNYTNPKKQFMTSLPLAWRCNVLRLPTFKYILRGSSGTSGVLGDLKKYFASRLLMWQQNQFYCFIAHCV